MTKASSPLIPFENKWVAQTTDRREVLASGATIRELEKKLGTIEEEVILTWVLPFDKVYSP